MPEERVQTCREQRDWGGALVAWIKLTRAYPHDDWPARLMVAEFRFVADTVRSA
jgi:hypothetical protein